jgi:L-lactate dehydrogenase complex protein LldG
MSSRDEILAKLRSQKTKLPKPEVPPKTYLPVTHSSEDLLARFTAEVERLTGKVYSVPDSQAAIDKVIALVSEDRQVLAWDNLPIPALKTSLAERGIGVMTGHTESMNLTQQAALRVGITGADAGFATTGTLALVTREGQARLPSLLPPVHIALLRQTDLFARMEDWLQSKGRAALLSSSSVAFITGPSRTSDIEMQTIVGVHGPKDIHVIVYSER